MNNTTTTTATKVPSFSYDELLAETRSELDSWRAEGMTDSEITERVLAEGKAAIERAKETFGKCDGLLSRLALARTAHDSPLVTEGLD